MVQASKTTCPFEINLSNVKLPVFEHAIKVYDDPLNKRALVLAKQKKIMVKSEFMHG